MRTASPDHGRVGHSHEACGVGPKWSPCFRQLSPDPGKIHFFFSISSLSTKCWFLNGTSDAYPFGCCAERLNSTLHITEESIHLLLTASFPAFENGAHKEAGPVTAHQESIVHSPTNVKTRNWSHISVARKHLSSIRSYVV